MKIGRVGKSGYSAGRAESLAYIEGAKKDAQSITADWQPLQELIDGVKFREIKNVLKPGSGMLTECFRKDWALDDGVIDQVFQNILEPG